MDHILEPANDPAWILESRGYDPLRESIVESRFAISNGFLGVMGSRSTTRGARWIIPARTYVAGLFDTPGADHPVPELIPAADWLRVRILLGGNPLVHHPGDVWQHQMKLDMRRGLLLTEGCHTKTPDLQVRVRSLRLVSMAERALGLQVIAFDVERGTADITFQASFEGVELGLLPNGMEPGLATWRTQHSGKRLAMATAASLWIDGRVCAPVALEPLGATWHWTARAGQSVCFARHVAVVRGDTAGSDPSEEARAKLRHARQIGWRQIVGLHQAAWAERWARSDIAVNGDADAQRCLRFALYHLNSAANPADDHVSIGARGLTGEDYRGHVFWDTEIFLLPFYIFTWPEAARALLMYRFRTLNAARGKAAAMGWRGALYAWESADTGEETTPEQVVTPDGRIVDVLCGRQEQHISADIAYAVWQYWQATGDDDFLRDAGAEIILETARFWASRAAVEADGHAHIRGVIGPDEYHEHIDDNAYTNVMARWNIRRGADVARVLRARWPAAWTALSSRIGLTEGELAQWQDVADRVVSGFDQHRRLYQQFSGYFGLEDIDLQAYAGRSVPMDMVLGRERIQASQIIKQADVVALLALLPDEFPTGTDAVNFRYYENRCSHGSSLSPAMHGLVAARLGDPERALRYFQQTATIDLTETHVTSDRGVHMAALGGLWMLAVFGFAGVSMADSALAVDPHLPAGWRGLCFHLEWRGRVVRIAVARDRVDATLVSGETMTLLVGGEPHDLRAGAPLRVHTEPAAASLRP